MSLSLICLGGTCFRVSLLLVFAETWTGAGTHMTQNNRYIIP